MGRASLTDGDVPGTTAAFGLEGIPAGDGPSSFLSATLERGAMDVTSSYEQTTEHDVASEIWTSHHPPVAGPRVRSLEDELQQERASPLYRSADRLTRDTASSLVVRKFGDGIGCRRGRQDPLDWPCSDLAESTRDDLLPTGSLRYSGYPTAEKYEELERATAGLEPMWADAHLLQAHETRMVQLHDAKLRIKCAPGHAGEISCPPRSAREPPMPVLIGEALTGEPHGTGPSGRLGHPGATTKGTRRRRRARRRLSVEASLRKSGQEMILDPEAANSDSDSECSSTWSDYDLLQHSLRRRADYQPVGGLARLRPSVVAGRAADLVSQHVGTLLTWLRFMLLLSTAVIFALWQCVSFFREPVPPRTHTGADLDLRAEDRKRLLAPPIAAGDSNDSLPIIALLHDPAPISCSLYVS